MLRTGLCDYNDAYMLVKETITGTNTEAAGADENNTNKKAIFKNFVPFISCISRINNTQIEYAQYIDIVMPMCNFIEYSLNYSKSSGINYLFQYCRDKPAVDNTGVVTAFNEANVTDLFNLKVKTRSTTGISSTKMLK